MFSILTPTFNRRDCLHRVYDSLIQQTFQDFHWIIVDDGSTDNTNLLVEKWIKEDKVNIDYHFLPVNQGKSFVVNYGLDFCKAPYTIIADSDDSFQSNTLSDLSKIWRTINMCKSQVKIASIWTLTKDENGKINGDLFPKDMWQVNFKERVLQNNIDGEKWACWRTNIISNIKMFAELNCHVEESQTWNRINKDYDFLCLNLAHRKYYDSSDGIIATSKNQSRLKISKAKFYNSYYGLKDVDPLKIIAHKFYWDLAYNYVSAIPFYTDKAKKLSISKLFISIFIFSIMLPFRVLKRSI